MLLPKRISVRNKKGNLELGMVVPNTQEVEARGTLWIQGQPELVSFRKAMVTLWDPVKKKKKD